MKRILAVFLCVVMCFSLMPASAIAEEYSAMPTEEPALGTEEWTEEILPEMAEEGDPEEPWTPELFGEDIPTEWPDEWAVPSDEPSDDPEEGFFGDPGDLMTGGEAESGEDETEPESELLAAEIDGESEAETDPGEEETEPMTEDTGETSAWELTEEDETIPEEETSEEIPEAFEGEPTAAEEIPENIEEEAAAKTEETETDPGEIAEEEAPVEEDGNLPEETAEEAPNAEEEPLDAEEASASAEKAQGWIESDECDVCVNAKEKLVLNASVYWEADYDEEAYPDFTYVWKVHYTSDSGDPVVKKLTDSMEGVSGATTATLTRDSAPRDADYVCYIKGSDGSSGTYTFHVDVENDLQVERSGEYWREVKPGKALTLKVSVSAIDTSNLKYEWKTEDDTVVGTAATLKLSSVEKAGDYYCYVSDRYGESDRVSYYVEVDNNLRVFSALKDRTTEVGVALNKTKTLKVAVTADDTSGLSYSWRYRKAEDYDNEKTLGSKTESQKTKAVNGRYEYICTVTDRYGNRESCWFNVHVENHLTVKSALAGEATQIAVAPNKTKTLKVAVSADDTSGLSYSWRWYNHTDYNNHKLASTTASQKTKKVTQPCTYECAVTDKYGYTVYCIFEIHVQNHLELHAVNVASRYNNNYYQLPVKAGVSKTLKVAATADDSSQLTYTWRRYWNPDGRYGNNWPGETLSSKKPTVKTGAIDKHYTYQCVVRDQYGNQAEVSIETYIENHLTIATATAGDNSTSGNRSEIGVAYGKVKTLKVRVSADDTKGLVYKWIRQGYYDDEGHWNAPKELSSTTDSQKTGKVTAPMTYVCAVTDRYGHQVSKSFYVYVENHLRAVSPMTNSSYWDVNTVYVAAGDTTTLKVKVTADNTEGLTYEWSRYQRTNLQNADRQEQLSGTKATLKTVPIDCELCI